MAFCVSRNESSDRLLARASCRYPPAVSGTCRPGRVSSQPRQGRAPRGGLAPARRRPHRRADAGWRRALQVRLWPTAEQIATGTLGSHSSVATASPSCPRHVSENRSPPPVPMSNTEPDEVMETAGARLVVPRRAGAERLGLGLHGPSAHAARLVGIGKARRKAAAP